MDQVVAVSALGVGTVLNEQYTIQKVLGIGGFGITYLCTDNFLKIKVAVKEFFPTQIANRDITNGTNIITASSSEYEKMYRKGLEDYEYEANKLTKFSGLDGIVSVLNFFFENGTAYMVMEYIEGITLKKYLNNHSEKVSWKEMLSLMKPIFASMKLIHDEGIIHRDISPDNIMISKDKKLTIIDFGSAKNRSDGEDTSIMLKHGYAPPEQYLRDGNQGSWTDVYALCATMYRMVVGKRPPKSIDVRDGVKSIPNLRRFDSTIPINVEKAIQNGLRSTIEERTPSVDKLERQLYSGISAKFANKKMVFGISLISLIIIGIVCVMVFQKKTENVDEAQTGTSTIESVKSTGSQVRGEDNVDNGAYSIPKKYSSLPEIELDSISYDTQDDYVIINKLDASISDGRIPDTIDGKSVKVIKGMGQNITNIMIPEGVEAIKENAFKNCVYLESLYIPSTVKEISEKAFINCQSVKEVELSADNKDFHIKDNTLYMNNGEEVFKW